MGLIRDKSKYKSFINLLKMNKRGESYVTPEFMTFVRFWVLLVAFFIMLVFLVMGGVYLTSNYLSTNVSPYFFTSEESLDSPSNIDEIMTSSAINKSNEYILDLLTDAIQEGVITQNDLEDYVDEEYITQNQSDDALRNAGFWYWMKFKIQEQSANEEGKRFTIYGWLLGFNDWEGNAVGAYEGFRNVFISWQGFLFAFVLGFILGGLLVLIDKGLAPILSREKSSSWDVVFLSVLATVAIYLLTSTGIVNYNYFFNFFCDTNVDGFFCGFGPFFSYFLLY
jgi:hypothetical protein